MLIGYEAKRLFKNFTGLGNYSRFVLNALCDYYSSNHYYLFTPDIKQQPEVDAIVSKKNITVISPPNYYPSFIKSIWRAWGIGRESVMQSLQVFHGLSQELPFSLPNHVRKVVTVHDLIFLRYPKFYQPWDVKIYKEKISFACKRADRIIAISKQTADDLIEMLGVEPSKIVIIYQGCHTNFKVQFPPNEIQAIKKKYCLPEKYLLNVGTIEARKNVLLIVKSILRIPESSRIPLVIVGRRTKYADVVFDFIGRNRLEQWVKFIHNASYSDFPAIYQGAEVFIYPSIIEGFGIPLIEAMESNIPVITSTGSALIEAGGKGSVFVEPEDDEKLAEAIQSIVGNEKVRQSMILKSREHLEKFQPHVIADDLMNLYTSLVS